VDFEGIVGWVERSHKETTSDFTRIDLERYMSERPCPVCGGARLKPETLAVKIGDKNIVDVSRMSVLEAVEWSNVLDKVKGGPLGARERTIAKQVLKEIRQRLGFPQGRRSGLPDHRSRGDDPLRWRGPADPARDPDPAPV